MALHLDLNLLEQARRVLEERGSHGVEGTALIVGGARPRLVVPEQKATGGRPGHTVEVTRAGRMQLVLALGPGETYAARIHSHPDEAFHSRADDANPALTFEGALSIVVPYYGLGLRHGLDACAVFLLRDRRWVNLPPGERAAHLTADGPDEGSDEGSDEGIADA
jgi:hypothetical protein